MKSGLSKSLSKLVRSAGPYALIELFLPGGTVLALLLWLSTAAARGAFATNHPHRVGLSTLERVVDVRSALSQELRAA